MQTHEYTYESLGKVIVAFQSLERSIENLINCSSTLDHTQLSIFMSEISFKAKVNIACSLLLDLHSDEDEVSEFGNIHAYIGKIRKSCSEAEQLRNTLVHSDWIIGLRKAPDAVIRMKDSAKSRTGYKYSAESISTGGLDSDIKCIEDTSTNINEFSRHLALDFNRIHGIPGVSGLLNSEKIHKQIYQEFVKKHQETVLNGK